MFGLLTTLVLAATAVQAQTLIPCCDRNITVASGDTCDGISAKDHSSTYQLAHVNPQINAGCTSVYTGELCLGVKGQDCTDTYVVQSGDTCGDILNPLNVSLCTLLANNPNMNPNCTNLYVGEVLCISSTIYPYNTTATC